MTHIYLIRHAESIEGLEDGAYRDLGLSPEGLIQAEKLRERLTRTREITADVLLSSPMRRAHETAQIIAPALSLPILLDDNLEEWRTANETMSPEEFMARWERVPQTQKAYYHWVEGDENRMEFSLRVHLTLNRIVQANTGKTIVIVSHGAFIQMSFMFFFGYGEAVLDRAMPEVNRTSLTHWYTSPDSGRWVLERSNDCHHLSP